MCENNTFGDPGGSGGVNNGGFILKLDGLGPQAHFFDWNVESGLGKLSLSSLIKREEMTNRIRLYGLNKFGLLSRRGNDNADICVLEDVLNLDGRIGFVDRDGNRTAGQGSDIDEGPLVRCWCQNRKMLTCFKSQGDEASSNRINIREELIDGNRAPSAHR